MADLPKLQVLLVDDQALVREGLRLLLEVSNEIHCIEASSAEESLDLLQNGAPVDLVLMDISMPGMNGLDALGIIHARFPQLPVLMHSICLEEQYATRAKTLGAVGYLSKNAPAAKILDAVKSAARGESCLPKSSDSHSS
jgi:DNA-binding NarL/FixJ family response regulator